MSGPIILDGNLRLEVFIFVNKESPAWIWKPEKPNGSVVNLSKNISSMISNGKEILALDEDGTLYLIEPNPEKLVIKESRKISEKSTQPGLIWQSRTTKSL